jgi:hypothetical protein
MDKENVDPNTIQKVFLNLTIKEMCRQVSVHCLDRGILLRNIFEKLFSVFELSQKEL